MSGKFLAKPLLMVNFVIVQTCMLRHFILSVIMTTPVLAQGAAYTGNGTLALSTPAGAATENKLSVTLSTVYQGFPLSSTQTTTVSGTLDVDLGASPQSGATNRFTIRNGNLSMTDMAFSFRAFFVTVASVNTSGMKGSAFTETPPGLATPTSNGGTFDASQHRVRIDQGAITGTANGSPITTNFTESPVEGPGAGTGTLTVLPGASTATHRLAAVTLLLPVDFSDTQDLSGNPVTVKVKGTIKATGTIPIPLNSWIEWTESHQLVGAEFTSVPSPGAAPLGLAWAMGYEPDTPAAVVTPVMLAGNPPSAHVILSTGGSRAPVTLEESDSLSPNSWLPMPADRVSSGLNPLPIGTHGPITVQWPLLPSTRRFLRLRAEQP